MKYFLPTEIMFERNSVLNNVGCLRKFGSRAFIITGKNSAKACGALYDIMKALELSEIKWILFDGIENNPSVETVERAVKIGRENHVDFVIGIGGGSPLDAAKAIAVLCKNTDMKAADLFLNKFTDKLPLIAIPTTSGTGSEVTQYSVLYRSDLDTKISFSNKVSFPNLAILDPVYTDELNREITVNTAIDAFTHCFEGFMGRRSSAYCDGMAKEGIKIFGNKLQKLIDFSLSKQDRDELMYMSMLGGMVIANAGVTIPHGMGYCYTCFHHIPHGKANGFLLEPYIKYNWNVRQDKIQEAMKLMDFNRTEDFLSKLTELLGERPKISEAKIETYVELSLLQKGSLENNPRDVLKQDVRDLWKSVM